MPDTPNYGFNRHPQFSVNHLSEYLATTNATQRTKVICAAKFPKKIEVAAYNQVRKPLKDALCKKAFGRDDLEFLANRLDAKARVESGYHRDEALRCAKAVRAFQDTFNPRSFSKYKISAASKPLSINISGVRVRVTLDASILEEKGGVTHSGGISILYAFSSDRSGVKERLSNASGLIFWALDAGQIPPLPRLCMSADIAGHSIVKASPSFERFRSRVTDSCAEVAARWDSIEPPHDYDGPEWK